MLLHVYTQLSRISAVPVHNLLPEERHHAIRARLASQGRVLAIELAKDLNTSEDTIRRDLRELAARGACQRVYGGALAKSPPQRPLAERQSEHPERKAALAVEAAKLVAAGQFVFLDGGSTNCVLQYNYSLGAHGAHSY